MCKSVLCQHYLFSLLDKHIESKRGSQEKSPNLNPEDSDLNNLNTYPLLEGHLFLPNVSHFQKLLFMMLLHAQPSSYWWLDFAHWIPRTQSTHKYFHTVAAVPSKVVLCSWFVVISFITRILSCLNCYNFSHSGLREFQIANLA